VFVAVLFLFGCASAFAQDSKTELPKNLKHPWGSFKEGSFVKMSMVQTAMGQEIKMDLSMTLTKLDADFAYVSQKINHPMMGEQEQEIKMSLKDFTGASQLKGAILKEKSSSKETVKVGEKEYACTVIEYDVVPDAGADKDQEGEGEEGGEGEEVDPGDAGVESGTVKIWFSDELPVSVKNETLVVAKGQEVKSVTTLVALNDKVSVAGKELTCYVYESKMEGASNADMKMWMSTEVPGFQVKLEGTVSAMGMEIPMTMEVSEFEAK
jgi:hypothetical protein